MPDVLRPSFEEAISTMGIEPTFEAGVQAWETPLLGRFPFWAHLAAEFPPTAPRMHPERETNRCV